MWRWLVVAAGVGVLVVGCAGGPSQRVRIESDGTETLADQPVHLEVVGLHAGEEVTINADAADLQQKQWHSEARVKADNQGLVNLDEAKPVSGTYQEPDGMGLFWSMNPPDGNPDQQFYLPEVKDHRPVSTVHLSVTEGGKTLATTTETRRWLGDGATTRALQVAKDGVTGQLFLPRPDGKRHPTVLLIGGSEGGMSQALTAALLASHGYPALTVAYFHDTGVPPTLKNIPLEYFASAARLLAAQPGVDPAHLLILGPSRGAEASLLVAEYFPSLVHGAILYAPTATVVPGLPDYTANAWTLRGKPVTDELIPVDHISGPVLAIAGADDGLWSSASAAPLIVHELDAAHNRYPHRALVYPGAGHNVGSYPYSPQGTHVYEPLSGRLAILGGTRQATATAQAQGWPEVLSLLKSLD